MYPGFSECSCIVLFDEKIGKGEEGWCGIILQNICKVFSIKGTQTSNCTFPTFLHRFSKPSLKLNTLIVVIVTVMYVRQRRKSRKFGSYTVIFFFAIHKMSYKHYKPVYIYKLVKNICLTMPKGKLVLRLVLNLCPEILILHTVFPTNEDATYCKL